VSQKICPQNNHVVIRQLFIEFLYPGTKEKQSQKVLLFVYIFCLYFVYRITFLLCTGVHFLFVPRRGVHFLFVPGPGRVHFFVCTGPGTFFGLYRRGAGYISCLYLLLVMKHVYTGTSFTGHHRPLLMMLKGKQLNMLPRLGSHLDTIIDFFDKLIPYGLG
jgi:hypothetical protein